MPNWKKIITSGSSAELNSLKLTGLVNAGVDTDKFLVLDSAGNVDFRTGANVLSDIGGQPSGAYLTTSTTFGGDVSGTYNAIVVGNDSHTHNANNLTGTTLASGVINSSLTSVGTIGTGTWQGTAISDSYISSATTWNNKLDSSGTIATNDYAKFNASGDLIGRSYTEVKTDLTLNNVENTALSTWAGSANITTLGTLSAGTWKASNISLAYGGTGASLSDPNDDRILFWDDTAGQVTWLDIGTNLSISGTTLNAAAGGGGGYEWFDGTTYTTASVDVSITGSVGIYKSGSTVFSIDGSQGKLFEVTDELSGSLFSVNDISGIPIFEVFSDDTVNIGTFNDEAIVVEGNEATIGLANGTVGAPSLNFTSDGNTGFYRSTTDTIAIAINGQSKFNINSSRAYVAGALGVGTTTPTTTGLIRATNDVVAFYSSDERLKDNIKKIENPIDKLENINGVEFDWIPMEGIHENEGHDVGVIAQEVEKVIPEIVETRDNGYKAVKYEKIVPLLIESIKELKDEIEKLKGRL